MFNKTASELPLRIEKFIMDVQEHDYVVEYHLGKTNIADYLSWHPRVCSTAQRLDEFSRTVVQAERAIFIFHIGQQLLYRRSEKKNATMQLSQKPRHAIQTGLNEADDELLPYMAEEVKHLLHVKDRVIYRGKRLIVPDSLQQRVIELGHESHQGTSETK